MNIKGEQKTTYTLGNIKERTIAADPGVSPFIQLNISIDANVNAALMGMFDMLNVFDAGMYNVLDTDYNTHKANETFLNVHTDWDMAEQTKLSYLRLLEAYEAMPPSDRSH